MIQDTGAWAIGGSRAGRFSRYSNVHSCRLFLSFAGCHEGSRVTCRSCFMFVLERFFAQSDLMMLIDTEDGGPHGQKCFVLYFLTVLDYGFAPGFRRAFH